MSSRALFLALATFLALAPIAAAAAAAAPLPCGAARELLGAGEEEAVRIARACAAAAPEDPQRLLALSQLLGWEGEHEEALAWAEAALSLAPHDLDLIAWRLRLLGWLGRYDEAEAALAAWKAIPGEEATSASDHRELSRIRADLAYWRGSLHVAAPAYAAHLERWPDDGEARRALAAIRLRLGDAAGARPLLEGLCEEGDGGACARLRGLRRRGLALRLQGGPIASTGPGAGWRGWVGVDAPASDRLHLRGGLELQQRRYGGDGLLDSILSGGARWELGKGLHLDVGGGFTLAPSFSPEWNLHLEGGVELGAGFTAYGRYWRIEFPAAGVDVLSPALGYEGQALWALARLWRSFAPDGDGLALLVQAGVPLGLGLELNAGVGGGDRADYLILRDVAVGVERHQVWLGGLSWMPTEDYQLRVDYVGRREASGEARLLRHELLFGIARWW